MYLFQLYFYRYMFYRLQIIRLCGCQTMGETFSEQKVSGEHVKLKWGLFRWKEEK